ncbi:serine O-acetyltransferase [Quatrionicoccus australiensis]|uniref:serine O-acetyltransferase n=1 Tax=Quatrionicoccus australiensis TaxID=138118 RepID=UPI001CF94FE3|nr:serine acetyltransferase [Quatrionicoccus australiensis]MCB4358671.1 serine acetyltransferase [Quatrionicoccus australiensis]
MSDLLRLVLNDIKVNPFFKSKVIVVLYRIAHYFSMGPFYLKLLGIPAIFFYIFLTEWILGVEIHPKTKIGKNFRIFHGCGLVINGYSHIGDDCIVRQGVTIGNILKKNGEISGAPKIGSGVEFGANSQVLGDVVIGDFARIGAGAVVITDVPSGATAVGVPARVILGRN